MTAASTITSRSTVARTENLIVHEGLAENDMPQDRDDILQLTTIRSRDRLLRMMFTGQANGLAQRYSTLWRWYHRGTPPQLTWRPQLLSRHASG